MEKPFCRCFPTDVAEHYLCIGIKAYLICTAKGDEWPNMVHGDNPEAYERRCQHRARIIRGKQR